MFLKSMGIQQQLIAFIHSFILKKKFLVPLFEHPIIMGQFHYTETSKTTTL